MELKVLELIQWVMIPLAILSDQPQLFIIISSNYLLK
jgi:hypothetical protein